MTRAAQLRALIRTDEALVDHLAPQAAELSFAGEEGQAAALVIAARLQVVGLRLRAREAELARVNSPAAPATRNESSEGSMVTTRAAQPE